MVYRGAGGAVAGAEELGEQLGGAALGQLASCVWEGARYAWPFRCTLAQALVTGQGSTSAAGVGRGVCTPKLLRWQGPAFGLGWSLLFSLGQAQSRGQL